MEALKNRILELKKASNTLILAHYYQRAEVQEIADAVGDSFALAQKAQQALAARIIVCGVRFMAESAKILNPDKAVFLPKQDAGCPMADMVTPEDVLRLREEYPQAAVVCYVNSSAAVKAVSDVCCTSSSALRIVRALEQKQIIFVPDKNLGAYCAQQVPEKEFILFSGCCPIHHAVTEEMARAARAAHPEARFAIHPECRPEVLQFADYIGSTAGILSDVRQSDAQEFVIGTECGIVETLQSEFPEKCFYPLQENFVCADMKKTTLEDVLRVLEGGAEEITLPEAQLRDARRALERMVSM